MIRRLRRQRRLAEAVLAERLELAELAERLELRISTPSGTVLTASFAELAAAAAYVGGGWCDLIAGSSPRELGLPAPAGQFSAVPLRLEIRAALDA